MKKLLFQGALPLIITFLLTACWSSGKDVKGSSSQSMAIHKHGIIIEAKYDPRLNNLIPGYKMLTVALTNQGVDVLRLNPLKDRWEIVDAYGKKHRAINSLRIKDPRTFSQLPAQVQRLIDYPVGVAVGYSETIDLFFPESLTLAAFRAISYHNSERKMTYDMLTSLGEPATASVAPPPDPRFTQKQQ